MKEILLTVPPEEEGERIDRWLSSQDESMSRSFIQKLIGEGRLLVNGLPAKSSYKIREGDQVSLSVPDALPLFAKPEEIPLEILYEDSDLLVVNKPQGMVVHPAAGHMSGTLVNALLFHCGDSLSGINGVLRPGIVHRIDRDTSGSLLVCKSDQAHRHLAAQLKDHSMKRRYLALVHGGFSSDEGSVDAPIARAKNDRKRMAVDQKGKRAVTHYRVLERFGDVTFLECVLETGRTHQIRVHLSSIGHPLLGDPVYGNGKNPFHLAGQALHAKDLGFIHPVSNEYMEFSAPLPAYYEALLKKLRDR